MSKRGIIGRVAQLAQANVGAVIDSAELRQQTAAQLARHYALTIAEGEHAIAQLASSRRLALDDQRDDAAAAELWARAAGTTSQTADEFRASGDGTAAARFDGFARVALVRQFMAEQEVAARQRTIAAQAESIDALTNGIGQMQIKLSELTHASRSLGPGAVGGAVPRELLMRNVDVTDSTSEVTLFQELVRREEARIRDAGAAGSVQSEAQLAEFAGPDRDKITDSEIGERLQALKTGRALTSALARAQDIRDHPIRPDPQPPRGQPFR